MLFHEMLLLLLPAASDSEGLCKVATRRRREVREVQPSLERAITFVLLPRVLRPMPLGPGQTSQLWFGFGRVELLVGLNNRPYNLDRFIA